MRARALAGLAGAAAVLAAGALGGCAAGHAGSGQAERPSARVTGAGNHVVRAAEGGTGRSASLIITDPYAAGSKLRKSEYHLHDGYTKRVIFPGGAFVAAEDIAICGMAGVHYPNNGFTGTGLQCRPLLHPAEVFYHQHTGDLAGRFWPHHNVVVTEICYGHGQYLTVGHIDHGALMSVEYYWANGEHLTVTLPGDVLVDHIRLIITGGRLGAVATRHT